MEAFTPKTTLHTPPDPPRASIIVPVLTGKKAWAERAIERLLAARFHGLPKIEIIAVDDGTREETGDYLKSIFSEAVRTQELHIAVVDRSGDLGALKNYGAKIAQGKTLIFLHPGELWEAPGLVRALENARQSDLQFAFKNAIQNETTFDALTLKRRPIWKGSLVVDRSLWDQVGGFSEGYTGFPAPTRIPGEAVSEFLIRAVPIAVDCKLLAPATLAEWLSPGPPPIAEIVFPTEKLDPVLRGISLLRVGSKIPGRIWQDWGARLTRKTTQTLSEKLTQQWKKLLK